MIKPFQWRANGFKLIYASRDYTAASGAKKTELMANTQGTDIVMVKKHSVWEVWSKKKRARMVLDRINLAPEYPEPFVTDRYRNPEEILEIDLGDIDANNIVMDTDPSRWQRASGQQSGSEIRINWRAFLSREAEREACERFGDENG